MPQLLLRCAIDMTNKLTLLSAYALFAIIAHAQEPAPSTNIGAGLPPHVPVASYGLTVEQQREHEAGLQWFRDAKFGVFIHFGLYSVPAGEWKGNKGYGEWFQIETRMPLSEYSKFAAQFNPTKFDAKEWVNNIKNAGFKYVVVVTKHHDGFAMYDTKLEDYSVVKATPWAHDPIKDLAEACKDSGVQLCLYYSLPDWHSRDFPARYAQMGFHGDPNPDADMEKYVAYMKAQIHEIFTQYGPIGAIWFDDGGAFRGVDRPTLVHAKELIDEVHELQPRCVIDDRLGEPADYDTPEQRIPAGRSTELFESCLSFNGHWGYNKDDHNWKSAKTILQDLATCASKGGNLLLGIGAEADGTFPPAEAMPNLDAIGKWLKANGDSIYGTTPDPFRAYLPWGCATQKGDTIYLHVFNWPRDGQLVVPLENGVEKAYLLTDLSQTGLSVRSSDRGTTISVPTQELDPNDTVIALKISNPLMLAEVSLNLAKDKPVAVSSVWVGREDELNKSHITDENMDTLWAAEPTARTAWVTVDLQAVHEVSSALLSDAPYGRTQAFSLEAQVNGAWEKISEGSKIGDNLYLVFSPVKAQLFRLNILKANDTPTLAEFQLFGK